MAVTLKEVAKKSKVSASIASRVLNNDPSVRVSEHKRKLVKEAAKLLNYAPHNIARSLALNKSFRIGIVTVQNDAYLYDQHVITMEVLRGVEEQLRAEGYSLSFVQIDGNNREQELEALVTSGNGDHDGLFLMYQTCDPAVEKLAQENNTALVAIDPHAEMMQKSGLSCVYIDREHAIYNAVDFLVKGGCGKIAFVGCGTLYEKLSGFKKYFADNNIPLDENLIRIGAKRKDYHFFRKEGEVTALKLFKEVPDVDGIITSDDWAAFGVLDAMETLGKEPATDIAVIGYDNIEGMGVMPFDEPVLTTLHNPRREIGREAAKMMLRNLADGGDQPVKIGLTPRMVIRKTALSGEEQPAGIEGDQVPLVQK